MTILLTPGIWSPAADPCDVKAGTLPLFRINLRFFGVPFRERGVNGWGKSLAFTARLPHPASMATIGFSDGKVFEISAHLERSFQLRVGPPDANGCCNWQGAKKGDGYGLVSGHGIGRLVRAHRLSFALHHGHLDATALVLHRCDNRLCVNPAHLYVGDQARNSLDMIERGRTHLIGAWRQA